MKNAAYLGAAVALRIIDFVQYSYLMGEIVSVFLCSVMNISFINSFNDERIFLSLTACKFFNAFFNFVGILELHNYCFVKRKIKNWHNWCVECWSTKSDLSSFVAMCLARSINFSYQTSNKSLIAWFLYRHFSKSDRRDSRSSYCTNRAWCLVFDNSQFFAVCYFIENCLIWFEKKKLRQYCRYIKIHPLQKKENVKRLMIISSID